jgi:hypothetical protein
MAIKVDIAGKNISFTVASQYLVSRKLSRFYRVTIESSACAKHRDEVTDSDYTRTQHNDCIQ